MCHCVKLVTAPPSDRMGDVLTTPVTTTRVCYFWLNSRVCCSSAQHSTALIYPFFHRSSYYLSYLLKIWTKVVRQVDGRFAEIKATELHCMTSRSPIGKQRLILFIKNSSLDVKCRRITFVAFLSSKKP